MNTLTRLALPAAALGIVGLASLGLAVPANAASGTTYQATLNALNHASGSGSVTITMNGDQATVDEHYTGLATTFNGQPYPHVQHIHIGGQGQCPTMSADKNGDGVVSTTEGAPQYGGVQTTLSTKGDTSPAAGTDIKIAPAGGSTDYSRTIDLSTGAVSALRNGTAVIVVHGLDPATLSKQAQKEKSDLVPSLPLAATSPALCGVLSSMPAGGVATGTGSTAGVEDLGLLLAGGGLLAAGGVLMVSRRRAAAGI